MSARKLVVLGMMTKIPVAGVVWQTMHYVEGFRRLGFDVYYVEAHARTPSMLMRDEHDDSGALAAAFIDGVMRRFGMERRWAHKALHADGRSYGLSDRTLRRLYDSAEVIVNLHGGTEPRPEHSRTGRLVYLETDPVQLQVELHEGRRETIDFLEQHCAHFTFAENYGGLDCALPVSSRFPLRPTRQPVVLDFWRSSDDPGTTFTTVGNWRQHWRDVVLDGESYGWTKHSEFARFLDLPGRTGARFELALSSYDEDDRAALEVCGWNVIDALPFSADLDAYRSYLQTSRGEFSAAKDQNVRLRTGWFSDRSATYLAAGRPVLMQDTGFCRVLPTGDGLFAVKDVDAAAAAVEQIAHDPARAGRAAAEVAREYFDAEVVLGRLLDDLGVEHLRSAARRTTLTDDLCLTPLARRPLRLEDETVRRVTTAPIPLDGPERGDPRASIVVVTHDNAVCLRLCLESVLANTESPPYELIVVVNDSSDETRAYLRTLARRFPHVHVQLNDQNVGFPRGCNQGASRARGDVLVLLNDDTVVPPGWLRPLVTHARRPDVGLVGPVTNRIGNEAEVGASYATYGGFLSAARERQVEYAGRTFEIPMPAMFCLALRRKVYRQLGPLDEAYGLGTLEDDDYARRARAAGYQLLCAEDVLVHHFGEASFGELVPTGEYNALLERNRRRFEQKWNAAWQPYERRSRPDYEELKTRVRENVIRQLPAESSVIVASRGDDDLVAFDGRRGWHFPQVEGGVYAGHYPADSHDAIAQLERLRADGGEFFVLPQTGFWWLDHYEGLARYLTGRCREVYRDDACVMFALAEDRS